MRKLLPALAVVSLLLASACQADEPREIQETPADETESPTPEPPGTFQLQGRVLEAIGSTEARPEPTPTASPTGTPAATPSPGESPTPTVAGATPTPGGPSPTPGAAIERGAPGFLSIRLTSYSGEATSCLFGEGDTVVVAFTRATQFTPPAVGTNERFPRNLRESNLNVQGTVADEENCILAANSIASQVQGATPTPTGGSPTPTPTNGSPSPAASPTPTGSPS